MFKKKNLGWLHVYDGYFIITCYFTEKHLEKTAELDIPENEEQNFYKTGPVGKLIPMIIATKTKELPQRYTDHATVQQEFEIRRAFEKRVLSQITDP